MDKIIKTLEENTHFMASLVKEDLPLLHRLDLLEQVYDNLQVLKDELPKSDFNKKFGKLEKSVNEVIDQVSDKKVFEQLIDKLTNLLG